MNNETIIEFGIRMMWIIMQISEAATSFGEKPHTVGLDDTALPHIKIENTAWKKAQYRKALVPFWKGNLFKIYF